MSKVPYFGIETPAEIEGERLEQLERVCDPVTTRRLRALGVGRGWSCLEVGAGRGSIARWLAAEVGPSGRVVAADVDARLVRGLAGAGVEAREHDVLASDFEPEAYDLVHARALLMNLPDPARALKRMADAVKPGGLLCLEEVDWRSLSAVDRGRPGAAEFERLSHAGFEAVRAAGASDGYFGRRVLGLVEALGFEQAGGDGVVQVGRGGDHPAGRMQRLALRLPLTQLLVTKGVMTAAEFDALCALYEDPSFSFVGPTLFGAWGRKPGGEGGARWSASLRAAPGRGEGSARPSGASGSSTKRPR